MKKPILSGIVALAVAAAGTYWLSTQNASQANLPYGAVNAQESAADVVSAHVLAMFAGWLGVVAGAAAGLLFVAWDRPRRGAVATFVVGPALGVAVAAVAASPFQLAWGAWFASGLGATASIGSGLVVLTHVSAREGSRA